MENNMSSLPHELKVIPSIQSKEELLHIANTIKSPKDSIDRYKLHLATSYFRQNLKKLEKLEFLSIISNPYFVKNIKGDFADKLLDVCINLNVSFPILLNNWFDNKTSYGKKIAYLSIINRENNQKQIDEFYEKDPKTVASFFEQTQYQSDAFCFTILKNEPAKILWIESWSVEQKCNWIINNKKLSINILSNNLYKITNNQILSSKVLETLYATFIDFISEQEKIQESLKQSIRIKYPISFLFYAKENNPIFFHALFSDKQTYSMHGSSVLAETNSFQDTLAFRRKDSLSETKKLFNDYKEQLLEPVVETMSLYSLEVHPFEFFLRNKDFKIFTAFSYGDNLSSNEKNILIAAAFCGLKRIFDSSKIELNSNEKELNTLKSWAYEILSEIPLDLFLHYKNKLNNEENSELIKSLEAFELAKTLNENLSVKSNSAKKMKV